MKIALDYDDTYTADRKFWKKFIKLVHEYGHEVAFVTFRMSDGSRNGQGYKSNEDIHKSAESAGIRIVFCEGLPKKDCFEADIWIDDKPQTIFKDFNTLLGEGLFSLKEPKIECKT